LFSLGGTDCSVGCTDTLYVNYDVDAVIDDGTCTDTIIGCTDPLAVNYTPFSNFDDGTCCYDNQIAVTVDGGSFQAEVYWSLLASDSTVIFSGGAPFDSTLCLVDDCYTVAMGDTYGDGWNNNTFVATLLDGTVIGSGTALNMGGFGNAGLAGSFEFTVGTVNPCAIYGCTDATAINYDSSATVDDGTCCFDNLLVIETGLQVGANLDYGPWSN
jgi:hypothetical protein